MIIIEPTYWFLNEVKSIAHFGTLDKSEARKLLNQ